MTKSIICFGTRPELIKLAPLIWEIQKSDLLNHFIIVNTNQHMHTMFEKALGIKADYDLGTFSQNQSLSQLSAKISSKLDSLIQELTEKQQSIDAIIAQGDTITTLISAQTAFFNQIPFFHVEAGLRSGLPLSPFPEECNRKIVSMISELHFVPSELEKENLLSEGVANNKIEVVGNTINDALKHFYNNDIKVERNAILISIHRKANQNENLKRILDQVVSLKKEYSHLNFIWLMHPAPYVTEMVSKYKSEISVQSNLPYDDMVKLYGKTKMVITDSGGIIEESAFLGIPRIIIRTDNERKGLLNQNDTFIHNPLNSDLKECFKQALSTKGVRSFIYGPGNSSKLILTTLVKELKLIPTKPKLH
jgi:UDP-N-acetylglucosamine 2-epimerase (non-hydrolysing)